MKLNLIAVLFAFNVIVAVGQVDKDQTTILIIAINS